MDRIYSSPPSAALLEAYHRTTYRIDAPDAPIPLRIGCPDPRLNALLAGFGAECWAFITAYNPGSRPQTLEVNERALVRLRNELHSAGYPVLSGEGVGDGWPPEPSFFVPGLAPEAAREIGRRYGQVAVVWGGGGGAPELLLC